MTKKLKKTVSILLSLIMVFSMFAIVPLSASAAVGDVLPESEYLTFTAEEAGSTVTLNVASGSNFQYDLNGTGLTGYTPGTTITLANAGDSVRFSGTGTKFSSSKHFSTTGKVACSGNVMSMRLNGGKVQGLENLCFRYMFYNCTGLTTAPDLLETDLKAGCYSYMFNGCTSLTTAPDLPATTLAESCYSNMFNGCTSLTTAPDLPATTLAESCYNSMFMGCTSLTTAPDLPATVLAINCYLSMFNGCTSMTEAPELPATTLANYCYQNMFKGCTSLTEAPELPATTLASYCYSNMFRDCKSLTEAPELPATNLAQYCYASMFYGCTSLTKAPELPATNLAVSCYNYMFYGCTSLTELPALPATTLQSSCYYGMFSGCKNIRISDEAGTFDDITYSVEYRIPTTGEGTSATNALTSMFTSTGGKFKGTPSINTTYYLPAPAPTYTVTWKNGDTTLETDTDVAEGTTPTYDGTTPEKASDTYYDYTFFGWSDGSNTYAADALPAVSGDVTYTAQYTATAKTFKAYAKKLTGETYTIENLTGETTVAQLKEIIADQIDIPATAQRLIFAGKQLEDAKTLAEYNIKEGSTFHLIIRGYTVTWLNYDNSELGTTTVQYGATPTYDGATPTQPEDAQNTYTFAGWKNGETTYAPDALPAVSGDVTYTAVYTADPKIPAPQLPDVIKDCTYYNSYYGVYANVPFAEMFNDIQNGALVFDSYSDTEKCIMDTKDYSYKFYDQAGTELQAENVCHDDSADGYGYRVIMNIFEFSNPISGPLYIVATAPAPATFKVYVKKLTGETYTIENLTGETTVAQLKEIIADQIDIPATAQRLIFAGKQLDDAKTLAEYNIEEESTIHLVIRGYTVTWKNWNGDVLETDENVEAGTLPKYDGATPVRPEDMNATYTFAAWDDGKTTYLIGIDQLPPVTGDVTYKAEYTADIKKLFVTHSVTLGGDIGVNFYIDSNVAGVKDADTAVVKFAWDGGKYIKEVNLKELTPNAKGWLKATVNVVAAQMAHTIEATAFINGNMFYTVDLFSVQDYAEAVYAEPEKYDPEKPEQLKALAKALLNYGSEAQTVFADALQEHPDRADKIVGQSDYSGVTAAAVAAKINGAASDLDEIASQLDAEFYTSSLIYLQNNTLRLYFTPESKTIGALDGKGFAGALSEYYYYADHANIPAAELDNQQTFNVNGVEFTYSPLDYVVAVLNSNSMNDTQKNLAKALFLYNQAANAYFD